MKPRISVVIPLYTNINKIKSIRHMVTRSREPIEIIFVVPPSLRNISNQRHNEKIVVTPNRGRGYNLAMGAKQAQGEVLLFLHSDTTLPEAWDKAILDIMKNDTIVGGAFSLAFDQQNMFLEIIIHVTNLLIRMIKSFSGDRAMFIRSSLIQHNLSILEVPIMEDAELSKLMAKSGRVIQLKEKVVTSASAFRENGFLRHSCRIILCSLWYAVGRDLEKIYNYYYNH